jgi:hypothetical protein
MASESESFLIETAHVDKTTAGFLSRYIQLLPDFDDDSTDDSDELVEESKPGNRPKIISKHARNILINWRALLLKVAAGAGGTTSTFPAHPVLGILGCLQVLYQLVELSHIELGPDQEEVVRKLWINKDNAKTITWSELEDLFRDSSFPPGRLNAILEDFNRLGIIEFDQDNDSIIKLEHLRLHDR